MLIVRNPKIVLVIMEARISIASGSALHEALDALQQKHHTH